MMQEIAIGLNREHCGIEAKHPNSSIRKCARVQLIMIVEENVSRMQ
ncbi:unnamed protein product [Arabidopsis lyrata]|nr:unnamed protein product [Arabidopsis lyrata]